MSSINANRLKTSNWSVLTTVSLLWLSLLLQPADCVEGGITFDKNPATLNEIQSDLLKIEVFESDELDSLIIVPVRHQGHSGNRKIPPSLWVEVLSSQFGINYPAHYLLLVDYGQREPDHLRWENTMINKTTELRQEQPQYCHPKLRRSGRFKKKVQDFRKLQEEKMIFSFCTSNTILKESSQRSRPRKTMVDNLKMIERNLLIVIFCTEFVKAVVIIYAVYSWRISRACLINKSDVYRIRHEDDGSDSISHRRERIDRDYARDNQSNENILNRDKKISSKQQNNIATNAKTEDFLLDCGKKNLPYKFDGAYRSRAILAESLEIETPLRTVINAARRGFKKKRRRCMVFVEDTGSDMAFQSGLHMY